MVVFDPQPIHNVQWVSDGLKHKGQTRPEKRLATPKSSSLHYMSTKQANQQQVLIARPYKSTACSTKQCRLQGSTKVLSTFVLLATKDPLTNLSSSLLSSFTSCESQWFPDSSLFAQNWKFSCKLAKLYPKQQTRGVSYWGVLAIYIKNYLKAKRRIMGNSNISPCKNIT